MYHHKCLIADENGRSLKKWLTNKKLGVMICNKFISKIEDQREYHFSADYREPGMLRTGIQAFLGMGL